MSIFLASRRQYRCSRFGRPCEDGQTEHKLMSPGDTVALSLSDNLGLLLLKQTITRYHPQTGSYNTEDGLCRVAKLGRCQSFLFVVV